MVNAGGLSNVAVEREGYDHERARMIATRVYETTLSILEEAERLDLPSAEVASRRVAARLEGAAPLARALSEIVATPRRDQRTHFPWRS